MLVSDLGDPLRFHHMLRVFKPSSPMSLGTWSLTVYSLPLTLIVAIEAAQMLHLLPTGSMALEWVRKSAVVFGLLPAFGSVAYKGVLFSTCSQPGWKDARWLGGCMANSALMLGCAELLAVSVLTGACAGRRRSPHRRRGARRTQPDPDRFRLPGNSRDPRANLQRPADLPCAGAHLGRRYAGAGGPPARRRWRSVAPGRCVAHRARWLRCSFAVSQDTARFSRESIKSQGLIPDGESRIGNPHSLRGRDTFKSPMMRIGWIDGEGTS